METLELFERLGVALAIGLLIGLERGWYLRERGEGRRVAGLRTFALSALLGGVWAALAGDGEPLFLAVGFAAFAAVLVMAVRLKADRDPEGDHGVTTLVAALLTFGLGALAVAGPVAPAAAGAVLTALLLNLKPVLHHWLQRLTRAEIRAVLKLGLISVVVLPVLPDRGLGPWGALNPYEIWWLVVLIAGISFVGYCSMRVAGTGRGVPLTGLLGGLASSTATTVSLAGMARRKPAMSVLLAGGTAFAAATMFPRLTIEVAIVNPALLGELAAPLLTVMAIALAGGCALWWRSAGATADDGLRLKNPCDLALALQFGALLALMMLLAEAARHWFGDSGVLALAAVAGLGDVDAIALSVARMARTGLDDRLAAGAILLAAAANTVVKVILAGLLGSRRMALGLGIVLGPALLGGALVLLLF